MCYNGFNFVQYLVGVCPVEDVIVDDGGVQVAGESVLRVPVGRVLGVEPFAQLVEELLDAVTHVLPDSGVWLA